MSRRAHRLVVLAVVAAGCGSSAQPNPTPDLAGCMPSPACMVDGGNTDMPVVLDGSNDCTIMCPGPDMDMTVIDMAHECADSSTCPAARPVCDSSSGTCVQCPTAGASSECSMYHSGSTPPTPLCGPVGACVQCLSKDDCAATNQTCVLATNTCGPCTKHSDCSTGVCKSGGVCAAPGEVAYVNNSATAGCSDLSHVSTPSAPYCEIQSAVSQPTPLPYVVVAGSATAYTVPVSWTSTAIAPIAAITIIGPGHNATTRATLQPSIVSPAIALTNPR